MAKKPKKRIRKKKSRDRNEAEGRIAELERLLGEAASATEQLQRELQQATERLSEAEEQSDYSQRRAEMAEEFAESAEERVQEALGLLDHTIARAETAEQFAEECADSAGESMVLRMQYEELKSKYLDSKSELESARTSLSLVEEAAEEAEERAYYVEKELAEAEQLARELAGGQKLPRCPGTFDKYLLSGALEIAVKQAKRHKRRVALLNFRVLRVKESEGLEPLLAKRLAKVVRDSDLLAKIAPYTFGVLLAEVEPKEHVRQIVKAIARRAESVFQKPLEYKGERFFPAVAIGISVFPTDSNSSKDLMRYAEIALSEAVHKQAPGVHYYKK